jgi:hypothetical protein
LEIMDLSIRAYARHRGVSHVAVKKAIDTGRITLGADGMIDANRADQEWERNTGSPRASQSNPRVAAPAPAQEPYRPAAREPAVETVASPLSSGGTSLLQARTVNEVVKAQTNKVRLARLKGDLVDRSQAIAHVFKLARTERDAWLNWPARISAQIAATLQLDPHTLHVALEAAVREHLIELGDLRPRID